MAMMKRKKYISKRYFVFGAAIFFVTVVRLAISQGLWIRFSPDSTYDDIMQITKAFSITNGQWLGAYNSLTLVKGVGYPLITAGFHRIGLSYLLGWNLIYVLASLAFLWAVWPAVAKQSLWFPFLAYCLVLFNPIAFDSSINRYYRDIGYYSLAFLAVSLFLGSLLRRLPALPVFLGGAALGVAVLTREDCQWLYIYAVACPLAAAILFLPQWKAALRRAACATVALTIGFGLVIAPVSWMNYRTYGTFALDEYNSGSYAQAYGALSRLDGGLRDPQITIPYEQRMQLYENSSAFARLYPYLDAPDALFATWKEVQGEYKAGYFSFVLRSAAEKDGIFADAQTADSYFTQLAQQVNAYCDTLPEAGPRRSGIAARFYPEYIPQILKAWVDGSIAAACYTNVSAIPVQVDADDAYLKVFEEYTQSECAANRYYENGVIVENYHPTGVRLWLQRAARILILLYQWGTPVAAVLALVVWLWNGIRTLHRRTDGQAWTLWVAQSSMLCVFLLRVAMLAYVHVMTFSTITTPAYQAASYPMLLGFIALTLASTAMQINWRKMKK